MMTVKKKFEASTKLYRELKTTMDCLEEQLSSLDLAQTLLAVENLHRLHHQIETTDLELLQTIDTAGDKKRTMPVGLLEEQRAILAELVAQNKRVLPKLQTRLTGYRTELLQIKNGISTMQGYQTPADGLGRHIDTTN